MNYGFDSHRSHPLFRGSTNGQKRHAVNVNDVGSNPACGAKYKKILWKKLWEEL